MIVRIMDYGDAGDGKFIEYEVVGLAPNQMEFLNANLEEETSIEGEALKLILSKAMLQNIVWTISLHAKR